MDINNGIILQFGKIPQSTIITITLPLTYVNYYSLILQGIGLQNNYNTLQVWYANQWFGACDNITKSNFRTMASTNGSWISIGL